MSGVETRPEAAGGAKLWLWGLVWFMPAYSAVWISTWLGYFGGEWPEGNVGQVLGWAGVVMFWGTPVWTVGMVVGLFFVGRRVRLWIVGALALNGVLMVLFFKALEREVGGFF